MKRQKGLCVRQCSDRQEIHVTAIPDLCINQNWETFTSAGPYALPTQTEPLCNGILALVILRKQDAVSTMSAINFTNVRSVVS
jgi:hypothetical protein